MGDDDEGNPLASQFEYLMETQEDFQHKLKQRLVLELNKMENHFQFIHGLLSKGVLCEGSTDSEATFGMKEMMAQLAIMIACRKGADKIGGLVESVEESGNPQLVSALQKWVKEDFGIGTGGDPLQGQGKRNKKKRKKNKIATGNPLTLEHLTQQKERTTELSSSGTKLIDKVTSSMDKELTEQIEGHLIGNTSKIVNSSELCSTLVCQNVLGERDAELKSEPQAVRTTFFDQAALPNGLSKLATFHCPHKSTIGGISAVQFDKEQMMACAADGTLNLWSWRGDEEEPIKIAVQRENITCFQYDEEILILGTGHGAVHLFDARTYEEKCTMYLDDPVTSLKFVESTLVGFTRDGNNEKVWWIDISRPDMRLLNQRELDSWEGIEDQVPGICMYPDTSFLYYSDLVFVHNTKLGNLVLDDDNRRCIVMAPYIISTLNVGDLISTDRVVVAGCLNGHIGVWNTSKLMHFSCPDNILWESKEVVGLCFVRGHLLSLDKKGKLLMWSGYDLDNERIDMPVPRVLAKSFSNVSSLVAYKRWFASGSSSEDGTINIWTLPDLWLRAV